MPISWELPHQSGIRDTKELLIIVRVKTITPTLAEKGDLESKSRANATKEQEDQPMEEKVNISVHLETLHRGESNHMLKSLKNTPLFTRGKEIPG